jgi:hypothetical protein
MADLTTTAMDTRDEARKLPASYSSVKTRAAQLLTELGTLISDLDNLDAALKVTHKDSFTVDEQKSAADLKADVVANIQALIA